MTPDVFLYLFTQTWWGVLFGGFLLLVACLVSIGSGTPVPLLDSVGLAGCLFVASMTDILNEATPDRQKWCIEFMLFWIASWLIMVGRSIPRLSVNWYLPAFAQVPYDVLMMSLHWRKF